MSVAGSALVPGPAPAKPVKRIIHNQASMHGVKASDAFSVTIPAAGYHLIHLLTECHISGPTRAPRRQGARRRDVHAPQELQL